MSPSVKPLCLQQDWESTACEFSIPEVVVKIPLNVLNQYSPAGCASHGTRRWISFFFLSRFKALCVFCLFVLGDDVVCISPKKKGKKRNYSDWFSAKTEALWCKWKELFHSLSLTYSLLQHKTLDSPKMEQGGTYLNCTHILLTIQLCTTTLTIVLAKKSLPDTWITRFLLK